MARRSTEPEATDSATAPAVSARRRRNLWLGAAIGGLALLFYATIILKTGLLGVPPGFR